MMPALWPGDLVLVERADIGDAGPGAIVMIASQGRLIVHRVVENAATHLPSYLLTQGDTSPAADPPVAREDFVGIVTGIVRNGKEMLPPRKRGFASRAVAAIVKRSRLASRVLQWSYAKYTAGRGVESSANAFVRDAA